MGNETAYSFRSALESETTPSIIVLSRQNMDFKVETSYDEFEKGAYVISDVEDFEGIIIASGSEVGLAIDTQKELLNEGIKVRVVSVPSLDVFNKQTDKYKESILPSSITKRLAIEMGAPDLWYRYSNNVYGINTFGV